MNLGRYMRVEPVGSDPEAWVVQDSKGRTLALIEWNRGWKCYEFHPEHDTGWTSECCRDLAMFMERHTQIERAKVRPRADVER